MILTGTDLVSPALHWTLPYLEDNIGGGKHTVYISKSTKFLYFDDKKVVSLPTCSICQILWSCVYVVVIFLFGVLILCYFTVSYASRIAQIDSLSPLPPFLLLHLSLPSPSPPPLSLSIHTRPQMSNYPDFREPMKKREWTFSKFVDELKSHIGRTDEYIYYQDTLTDAVGTSIKHDFVHFNWRWLNDRKKRYNWGQLTTNLLLIGQPGNITPCHYDEQHNFFCEVSVK